MTAIGGRSGYALRVLLVDDEEEFASSVARVLRRRGFTVEIALSAMTAFAVLQEQGYRLNPS